MVENESTRPSAGAPGDISIDIIDKNVIVDSSEELDIVMTTASNTNPQTPNVKTGYYYSAAGKHVEPGYYWDAAGTLHELTSAMECKGIGHNYPPLGQPHQWIEAVHQNAPVSGFVLLHKILTAKVILLLNTHAESRFFSQI